MGVLVAPPSPARAAAPTAVAWAYREAAALTAAASTGTPVEVISQRGESKTVFANPDGTLTMESSNVPVRVRAGSSWVPVDTTLIRQPDGSVAPRAAALAMTFSGGGSGPLARIQRGGGSLDLVPPFALPSPTLVGDSATYSDVLPGVDLVVRAGPDTFSELFVVKSATAAANPALTAVTFTTRASGLTVQARTDGGVDALDTRGAVVLTGPAPILWDSSSTASTAQSVTATVSASGASAEDNDSRPAEGDRIGPVAVSVTSSALTLRPDTTILRGAGTAYPVYLDPSLSATRNGWAMVNKTYASQEYWKWSGDSDHAEGMGYINDSVSGIHTKRLFYQFTTSALNGKTIYTATFRAFETHAYSCTASTVEAWHVANINSATNWDNQPANVASTSSGLQDSKTVAYGRSGCSPGGAWVSFDVLAAVKHQTSRSGTNTTIKLKGASESSSTSWKRFQYGATLSITYNTTPAAPSGLRTIEPTTSCATGTGRPVIPNDPPKLIARISDVDAGENVYGSFELYNLAGTWSRTFTTAAAAPNIDHVVDLQAAYPLPAGMSEGTYKWRVRSHDPKVYGPYSGWCEFTVDKTAPAPPTVAPTAATQALMSPGPFPYGATASFTVTATDPGVRTYKYSVNSAVPTSAAFTYATTPTFSLPLSVYGPVLVRVWTYDQAGNKSSSAAEQPVMVGGVDLARDLRARWRMDATSGTVAPDTVGVTGTLPNGASPMTLSGGAGWAAGVQANTFPADGALGLSTSTSPAATAATTSTTVLDLKKNTTMMAWVTLSATTTRAVAVSHDATGGANFTLEERTMPTERPDPLGGPTPIIVQEQHFVATVRVPGVSTPVIADVPHQVVFGDWYHLAATWAPGYRELTLELADSDGATIDVATVTASADVDATAGAMRAGGAMTSAGGRDSYWPGLVDEVAVYSNAIPPEQLAQIRTQPHG